MLRNLSMSGFVGDLCKLFKRNHLAHGTIYGITFLKPGFRLKDCRKDEETPQCHRLKNAGMTKRLQSVIPAVFKPESRCCNSGKKYVTIITK
ncbi:MAG: hypothetical protein C4576_12050 [Desulfobacteraceae bacterium]|nr:MAG: hypothetical protein C4576_12050 [Desulfobacteraceae bacterium]